MRLGTRLLLLLLPVVVGIMTFSAVLGLQTRQASLIEDTRLETQAYARALAVALNHALRDAKSENIQAIINQVSEVPTIYGILVYDRRGQLLFTSAALQEPTGAPTAELRRVLGGGGEYTTFVRTLQQEPVFSVLHAIRGPRDTVTGALEVAQSLSSIQQEAARTRRRYAMTTLALVTAITLVTLWIVRRTIARPLGRLVDASQALGAGDLGHRIDASATKGELTQVARAFNSMAEGLEQTRAAITREAEERVELERRLRESEKMAAIGSLATSLAHEIAAPLNVISGRAEMMLKRESDQEGRERQLRIIVQQIHRITAIVRNLLDFARRRDPRPVPIDLDSVLTGVNELLEEELARARVTLDYNVAASLAVHGDPDLLHQVFVNLYLNAIQAMELIDSERRLSVSATCVAGAADRPVAVIEVRDTGPGIHADVLDRVFDPFVTTKPRGTGLGLVVARSIIQEHGGELTARNADPKPGAVFQIRLPALPLGAASLVEANHRG